jgi:hypothetical protein
MKNLIIYALCLGTAYLALGQEEKETITKDISFRNGGSNPVLQVDNINGDVLVESLRWQHHPAPGRKNHQRQNA